MSSIDEDDRDFCTFLDDKEPDWSASSASDLIKKFLQQFIDSLDNTCARCGFKEVPVDDSEYAVSGMLAMTKSIYPGQLDPLGVQASQEDIEEFASKGGFYDGTFACDEEDLWDVATLDSLL
jgi:hypothetical protein